MELTKKVLIIASVALALVIALIGISIAALYYSLNPSLYLGNIQTGSISASSNITTTGTVTSNGLYLPNPAGSTAILNYNAAPYSYSTPLAGAYASTNNWTATFLRTGNMVVMQWGANFQSLSVSEPLSATIAIPTQFIPSITLNIPIIVSNASSATNGLMIIFASTGTITIYATVAQGPFTSGNVGILPGSTSWSFA